MPGNKNIKLYSKNLSFFYGNNQAVFDVSIEIPQHSIVAMIGPSGCGKTTFLRCFNRMHDLYPGNRYQGEIFFDNQNILSKNIDVTLLRSKIGMVFQKPTPFPMSISDNISYGLKLNGIKNKTEIKDRVESALRSSALWKEVKDRLKLPATGLSGGQQQRLVIARALAVEPQVMLFDEPTSALDPISTSKIEELAAELKKKVTIIIVTHNMQQAARISDYTAFMYMGKLIEYDETNVMFTNPQEKLSEDYITGRFG
ncbi:MAG: phosphate ABC transporter ATP-binding protein PstB [Deltaproteobacteria bacterium]|nr:phosphate ABC transporter ATP-binding protein PstB [Deltaproteobacteria bacterium]